MVASVAIGITSATRGTRTRRKIRNDINLRGQTMNQDRVNMDIPLARYRDVLSWDQPTIDRLVEASVRLAVQVGIRIDNDEEGVYLSEAETRGSRVANST